MKNQITKTLYLHGDNETIKDGKAREAKIIKVQKKLGGRTTQAGAVRHMIDAYTI